MNSFDSRPAKSILAFTEVSRELDKEFQACPPWSSSHQAVAILLQEVANLLDAIVSKEHALARTKAIQVAAMAIRFLVECPQ